MNRRNLLFLLLTLISGAMAFTPLVDLIASTFHGDYYSHIPLIPLVSAYLLLVRRNQIISDAVYSPLPGLTILLIGFFGYGLNLIQGDRANLNNYTAILVSFSLLSWIGSFILCYGLSSFRKSLFPILFLGFMIPIPTRLLDGIIFTLQTASADMVYWLFTIIGLDFHREGFVFQLPAVSIEVARQCSGIRSSLALFITSVLGAYLFLRNDWHRLLLVMIVFPVAVFKNGIRIMTLTLLAIYVDEGFLTGGFLHKSGGFVFYIPALVIMGGVLMGLRKREKKLSGIQIEKCKPQNAK